MSDLDQMISLFKNENYLIVEDLLPQILAGGSVFSALDDIFSKFLFLNVIFSFNFQGFEKFKF